MSWESVKDKVQWVIFCLVEARAFKFCLELVTVHWVTGRTSDLSTKVYCENLSRAAVTLGKKAGKTKMESCNYEYLLYTLIALLAHTTSLIFSYEPPDSWEGVLLTFCCKC